MNAYIKSILVLLLLVFSISIFSISVDADNGDIANAVVDSWEWDTDEGRVYNPLSMVRLGTSNYFMTSAGGDTAADYDGFLRILEINDDGTFVEALVDKWEYDTTNGIYAGILHIADDIYAVYYEDTSNGEIFTTTAWSSNGTLDETKIDSVTYTRPRGSYLLHVTGDIYALSYEEEAGGYDHFLETYEITSAGDISARIDVEEYDESNTAVYTYTSPTMALVDSDTVAIVYSWSMFDGRLVTYNISDAGVITDTYADYWEFDGTLGVSPYIKKISGNVFAIAYEGTDGDGFIKTVTIADDGTITASWIDALEFDTGDCIYPMIFTIENNSMYGIVYRGVDSDGFVCTFNMSSAGIIDNAIIDVLEFETADNSYYSNCLFVAGDIYAIIYTGTATDGWACTVNITFSDTIKPVSSVSNSGYLKNFNWFLIHGNASDDDSGVNATELWYRYSTDNSSWGAWTYADNDTTNYENPAWMFNFNTHGGYGYYEFYSRAWDNLTNYEDAPLVADYICRYVSNPIISSPVPADGSEIDYDDATGLYNVTITDAFTTFNWTIEIYYTGAGYMNNSGTDDTTGVKHCFYGFGYNYSYLVYVNVTNSFGLSADETYTFDIEPNCPPSVNWTYPANNSENNSLALTWECTFNDTTPGLSYWWEIDVYNNDTGIIFQNIDQLVLTTNTTANINLFGMNQSTWYRVEVKLYEPGAEGCEECIGVDPSAPTSRNATFYFKTANFTGYTWWDTDWKAKKLIKFDVNESEAEDLQVLINISKGPYGFPDNLATFPPTIYINSSNLGECRFVAQYWNTTDSTWGDTELFCYAELNSKTYDYITLPYEGAPIGADWIHVWVRLPPSNDTDKEYNRTAGEIWVYYKNLDHYPYNPISTTLELNNNGNDTFDWFRGFNEWIDESEWTQHTSGKHVWATLPITGLNSTDKRLRFYQYMYQYHEAAGVDQYMDLFYVASTTGYNSAEKLSYYIKVDHATDKLYYYATGNHAGAPFTLMSAIMDWDAGGVYGFHDLIWYNDTEILINAYDYNGNFAGDADTSQTLDASLFKYIGFHMYTDVFAYSCQWGWDDTFLPSSLWQHVYDQWGDAEIYTSQLYCSIGKYIGREPTVTTTLLVELPYFILYTPTNGETDVELNPILTGMVINGMGNAFTQWWYYDPSLGWYNWLGQDNITNHSQVISLNTSLINDVFRQMINDGLWGSEYDTVYKWRITVTDGYTTFTKDYEFTTRFAIIANFTYVINGQQVIFTDTSTGAIDNMTTWYWDYGDGTTEDGVKNPVHYFYASANFTVTLTIEQITYHWSSEHNETLMMYVAPTVAPISILWQFDWGMFVPYVYILIILMLFLVLIFTIFRSARKRYKPPRR